MSVNKKIKASKISQFLNAKLFGKDIFIENITPIQLISKNCLSFAKKFDDSYVNLINNHPDSLIICLPQYKGKIKASFILSDNPRLDFMLIIKHFFSTKTTKGIDSSAKIHPKAKLGKNIFVGANSFIGPDVSIGDNSIIYQNVVISGRVRIGKNCVIKSNSVVGEEGFGFEYNKFGIPEHFPHIGKIEIENNVWVGACTTIEIATIDKTIIRENVKIDDHVQIGHNSSIGRNTLIMAGSIICGGATIGQNCWIAPNTSIKEKLNVGDNAYIGLGSVVINNIPKNIIVVGNPAKELRKRL